MMDGEKKANTVIFVSTANKQNFFETDGFCMKCLKKAGQLHSHIISNDF